MPYCGPVPQLDLSDDTFVAAEPGAVSTIIHQPRLWRRWWPELHLTIFEDRAERGIRWNVTGALRGSMEVWLEPSGDGVVVHYYLRADPVVPRPSRRWPTGRLPTGRLPTGSWRSGRKGRARLRRRWQLRSKRIFFAVKDELERGRPAGEPPPAGRG